MKQLVVANLKKASSKTKIVVRFSFSVQASNPVQWSGHRLQFMK